MSKNEKVSSPHVTSEAESAATQGRRPFTFDRVVRILFSLAIVLCAVWLINQLSDVLLPFLVAWLIAYIFEPFVQMNRQILGTRGRVLAVFVTLFEAILVLTVVGIFLVPSIVQEMHQMATLVRQYAESPQSVPFIPEQLHTFLRQYIDFDFISAELSNKDIESVWPVISRFVTGGLDIIIGIFNWFLVILYVVFIMLDYERLLRGFKNMVPPKYRHITFRVARDVKNSMNHYFRGQALVAFIVGILFSIGFLIVGLPLAVVLGLFIGLLNMVPYLQLISIIPTTILCLVYSMDAHVDFWTIWWECMCVYTVVQCTQDLFLTPKIMGKAMGLNPAIILLSLSVWGTLLGFIGLIIALPLTTLILSYYNRFIAYKSREAEI